MFAAVIWETEAHYSAAPRGLSPSPPSPSLPPTRTNGGESSFPLVSQAANFIFSSPPILPLIELQKCLPPILSSPLLPPTPSPSPTKAWIDSLLSPFPSRIHDLLWAWSNNGGGMGLTAPIFCLSLSLPPSAVQRVQFHSLWP